MIRRTPTFTSEFQRIRVTDRPRRPPQRAVPGTTSICSAAARPSAGVTWLYALRVKLIWLWPSVSMTTRAGTPHCHDEQANSLALNLNQSGRQLYADPRRTMPAVRRKEWRLNDDDAD